MMSNAVCLGWLHRSSSSPSGVNKILNTAWCMDRLGFGNRRHLLCLSRSSVYPFVDPATAAIKLSCCCPQQKLLTASTRTDLLSYAISSPPTVLVKSRAEWLELASSSPARGRGSTRHLMRRSPSRRGQSACLISRLELRALGPKHILACQDAVHLETGCARFRLIPSTSS